MAKGSILTMVLARLQWRLEAWRGVEYGCRRKRDAERHGGSGRTDLGEGSYMIMMIIPFLVALLRIGRGPWG
jgi:hypothetical protein